MGAWRWACIGALALGCSKFSSEPSVTPDAAAPPPGGSGPGPGGPGAEAGSEADAGLDGDVASDDGGVPPCDGGLACTRVVFVTSQRFRGDFGGAATADDHCNELANGAAANTRVRGKQFKAWVSEGEPSRWPAVTMVEGTGPYVRSDGRTIADGWIGFASASHLRRIDLDESGGDVSDEPVWTGTAENGTGETATCGGQWSATLSLGAVGSTASLSATWSHSTDIMCSQSGRLYCVEQ